MSISRGTSRLIVVFAAIGLSLWPGPDAPGSQCCRNATGFPPPGCIPCDESYGYYPTCWRRWSANCHDCPPVATGNPEMAPLEEVEAPMDEGMPSDVPEDTEGLPELQMPMTDDDPPPEPQAEPMDPSTPSDEATPPEGSDSEPMPGAEKSDPMHDEPPPPPPAGTNKPMPLPMPMETTPEEDSFNAPRAPAEPRRLHSQDESRPRRQVHSSFQATFRSTVSFRPREITQERHQDVAARDNSHVEWSRTAGERSHDRLTQSDQLTDQRLQEQRQQSVTQRSDQFPQQAAASGERRPQSYMPPRPAPTNRHAGLGPEPQEQPASYSAPRDVEPGLVRRVGTILPQKGSRRMEAPRPALAPPHSSPPRALEDRQLSLGRRVPRTAEPPRP